MQITTGRKELRKISVPSHLQKAIADWVLQGTGNAVVNAGPGSGKSTLLEHITALILEQDPNAEIIDCMYNRHIAEEAIKRGMPAKTTHQMGLTSVIDSMKNRGRKAPENFVDKDKVNNILVDLVQQTWDEEKWLIGPVADIVSKLKNTLAPTDNQTIEKICERYGIETNGSLARMCDLAREALRISNDQADWVIDFDDMIYLPVKKNLPVKQYKYLLFDELQDANRVQLKFAIRSLAPGGRFIGVGDRFQSIYGFRGADPESMDRAKEAFSAIELPLSITYRCAKSHVRLLNQLFPNQPLEAFEGNKEGAIEFCSEDALIGRVQEGDLVLCRVNAALVKPCFALIRQGIKAIIRGRDIGKSLINLIEKFEVRSNGVPHLIELLKDYERIEVEKLMKAKKGSQAESLQDKVETIIAISDGCYNIGQIKIKINEVFSDKKVGVVFSTIHRAKGDEAENVSILRPDLLPHPMGCDQDWSYQQELNIIWVALSRSKNIMTFVGGLPKLPSILEEDEVVDEREEIKNKLEAKKAELAEVNQMIKEAQDVVDLLEQMD